MEKVSGCYVKPIAPFCRSTRAAISTVDLCYLYQESAVEWRCVNIAYQLPLVGLEVFFWKAFPLAFAACEHKLVS